MADWKCGASRDFPIQDGDPAWDGGEAEKAIFEWAGGDEFDQAKARRCFLAYDASAGDQRGSYKLPFVHIVNGEPQVPKSALRAASGSHGIGAADIGGAKSEAEAVLDSYKKKAKIGDYAEDDGDRARRRRRNRRNVSGKNPPKIRGMYGVAMLAYAIDCVADVKYCAEIEKSMEGDDSQVPAMLKASLASLGEALVAMTNEEVAELLASGEDGDGDESLLDEREREQLARAKTPALRQFLLGVFNARAAVTISRAGATLSAANAAKLGEVDGHHSRALEHHRAATESMDTVNQHHSDMRDGCASIRAAHDGVVAELDKGDTPDPTVLRSHHRAIERGLNAVTGHLADATDEHEAAGDSQRGVGRHVRAAQRVLREVDGYTDSAAKPEAQTSAGAGEGTASEADRDLDFRRREAEALRLGAVAAE